VKNIKSIAIVSGQTRRAALGEIGNKVIVNKANELTGKSSQTAKDKVLQRKPTLSKQTQAKVDKFEKVVQKVQVQIIKPVVKTEVHVDNRPLPEANKNETDSNANKKDAEPNAAKKETDSFSSDLITIEDIDEEDRKNPILVSVYSNDIYAHLRDLEMQFSVRKGYLHGQEVTPKMRCVLVDWLIEVHEQFHLMQETLYMTIAIIDRFLQV
jgi:hypothetical protein